MYKLTYIYFNLLLFYSGLKDARISLIAQRLIVWLEETGEYIEVDASSTQLHMKDSTFCNSEFLYICITWIVRAFSRRDSCDGIICLRSDTRRKAHK